MSDARDKPLLIYDGTCRFCCRWIERWQALTGEAVDYAAYQDVAGQFPEIDPRRFDRAVQLVEPDGDVHEAAEAVFRVLATVPGRGGGLWMYRHLPGFAGLSEVMYRGVARHRGPLSRLTTLLWGGVLAPPSYLLTRWLTVRLIGFVFLIAFASLLAQIDGLVGQGGIMPAAQTMDALQAREIAWTRAPTLAWLGVSDQALRWGCIGGMVLAAGIIVRVLPALCLFLSWALYLSYVTICAPFLNFQWDILLLETGFLCIFIESWHWRPNLATERPPATAGLWMLRVCLFKLMVASGLVKLLAGDAVWNELTALTYHYWTQPIPNVLAWYAHQLPLWTHRAACFIMFVIELGVPLAIFLPRAFRIFAGVALIGLQVLIALTGNYTFFNLLTAVLCIALFDDRLLSRFLPRARQRLARRPRPTRSVVWQGVGLGRGACVALLCGTYVVLCASVTWSDWQRMLDRLARRTPDHGYSWLTVPDVVDDGYGWVRDHVIRPLRPFRTVNSYGLFRTMTRTRPELIIEGSQDGETWVAYEFEYKPGDVARMPPFVAPHQPRLDWQMWFEALHAERQMHARRRQCSVWFARFLQRLRAGAPEVIELLERNPFPLEAPQHVRARLYHYRFTTPTERAETGNWWAVEYVGVYYGLSR